MCSLQYNYAWLGFTGLGVNLIFGIFWNIHTKTELELRKNDSFYINVYSPSGYLFGLALANIVCFATARLANVNH